MGQLAELETGWRDASCSEQDVDRMELVLRIERERRIRRRMLANAVWVAFCFGVAGLCFWLATWL